MAQETLDSLLQTEVPTLYAPGEEASIHFINMVIQASPYRLEHLQLILELISDHCLQFPESPSGALWNFRISSWILKKPTTRIFC